MPARGPLEDEVVRALRQIVRALDLRSHRLAEECGLTGPQLTTLVELHLLGSVPLGELARAVHVSQATMSGILDRLERRLLVVRERGGADRRNVVISLTPEGRAVLENAPAILDDRFRTEFAQLAEWERTQLVATLQRVAAMMNHRGPERGAKPPGGPVS